MEQETVTTQAEHDSAVPLRTLMIDARTGMGLSQKDWAVRLGFTPQYICDLEQGRRIGSVQIVNRMLDAIDATRRKRREWHAAGARAHGWCI